jgi:hypothetical protein
MLFIDSSNLIKYLLNTEIHEDHFLVFCKISPCLS